MAQFLARLTVTPTNYRYTTKTRSTAKLALAQTELKTITIVERVEVPINTRPTTGVIYPRGMK